MNIDGAAALATGPGISPESVAQQTFEAVEAGRSRSWPAQDFAAVLARAHPSRHASLEAFMIHSGVRESAHRAADTSPEWIMRPWCGWGRRG